jgi:hypothetical protein
MRLKNQNLEIIRYIFWAKFTEILYKFKLTVNLFYIYIFYFDLDLDLLSCPVVEEREKNWTGTLLTDKMILGLRFME